jgi:deazaflavin-dependent oxidoreductase (nitroreductase family)
MTRATEPAYLYLTTTGRRSGRPRKIEIWFTERDGWSYVIAETGMRAQWVRNLQVNPRVRWRVAEVTFSGQARVVDAAAEPVLNEAVQALSREKYGWGEGLVVELIPDIGV